MDTQKLAVTVLLLVAVQKIEVVHSTLPNPKPTPNAYAVSKEAHQKREIDKDSGISPGNEGGPPLPTVNIAGFPKLLNLRMLQNMPMVILHPSKPISLQLLPNGAVQNQKSVINSMLKILGSASQVPLTSLKSASDEQNTGFQDETHGNKHNNKNKLTAPKKQSSSEEEEVQDDDTAFSESSSTAVKHNARGFRNPGWLEKFRGTFSNMFPQMNPFQARPMSFGFANPVQLPFGGPPKFPNNLQGNMNPYFASDNNPIFVPFPGSFGDFRIPQHRFSPFHPGHFDNGDFSQAASHQFPLIHPLQPSGSAFRLGLPFGARRRLPFPPILDQMTSASESIPYRVKPPFGGAKFVIPPSPGFQSFSKHKNTPIAGPSAEISDAFADFAASEQEPEVVEGFASVGSSITKFLNLMGLGVSGITQGFGDFTARDIDGGSLDFFPGYGNQAMLDDIDDMDVFQEDITDQYQRKQPKTTKAPQKPTTKPPKPTTAVPTKKSTVSKPMATTKPTGLPNPAPKLPSETTMKDPKQEVMMHPKTNGSMMGKMSQSAKMEMGEQGKRPHKGNHPGAGGGPNPEKDNLPKYTVIKNHQDLKMMSPSSPSPPPLQDLKHQIQVNQNQKQVHTGHPNFHHLPIHLPVKSDLEHNKMMSPSPPPAAMVTQHDLKHPIHVNQNQKEVHTGHANFYHLPTHLPVKSDLEHNKMMSPPPPPAAMVTQHDLKHPTHVNNQNQKEVHTGHANVYHLPAHTPLKNHLEPNKMVSPPPPSPPEMMPQHDLNHPIHVNLNQKHIHTGHANIYHGGAGNVQGNRNYPNHSPDSRPDTSKTHAEGPATRPPIVFLSVNPIVHTDNNQKYAYTWDNNAHINGNRNLPNVRSVQPLIHFYNVGDVKTSDNVWNGRPAYPSSDLNPQLHQNEKQMSQTNTQKDPTDNATEKKSVPPKTTSNETSYASAHSMPSESESPELLNTDDLRPWIPVSTGQGYVERRPVSARDNGSPWREQVKEIVQLSFRKQRDDFVNPVKKN